MKNRVLFIVLGICILVLFTALTIFTFTQNAKKSKWDIVDARIVGTKTEIDSYTTNSYVDYKLEFIYHNKANHTTAKCSYSASKCHSLVGKYIKVRVEPKLNAFNEYGNVEIESEKPFDKN
ncbi:MAG: hypothetical protein IJH13_03690 [Bacilli bacterium]|nr:hypothetical protein [Bacilli bacterium]